MINFIEFKILSKIYPMIKLNHDIFERSQQSGDHFVSRIAAGVHG
jgi:hypothetical protein